MRTILVVDDEPAIRDFVGAVLEDEGYDVVVAETGRQAVDKLYTELPDLVLVDVMMPEMDGREVVRWVRDQSEFANIPIVMMSAAARFERLHADVNAFLRKPFDLEHLLDTIEHILNDRQMDRTARGA